MCRTMLDDYAKAVSILTLRQVADMMDADGLESLTPKDVRDIAMQLLDEHPRAEQVRRILQTRVRFVRGGDVN